MNQTKLMLTACGLFLSLCPNIAAAAKFLEKECSLGAQYVLAYSSLKTLDRIALLLEKPASREVDVQICLLESTLNGLYEAASSIIFTEKDSPGTDGKYHGLTGGSYTAGNVASCRNDLSSATGTLTAESRKQLSSDVKDFKKFLATEFRPAIAKDVPHVKDQNEHD